MLELDYSFIWAGIIALAVLVYAMLDGFDLGVGMLFGFFREEKERDRLMNSVAPVWDGNETWLILGGGGLFAAFPVAYGLVMSSLYAPIIAMLLALAFRGVAFEFVHQAIFTRKTWEWGFFGGSLLASFCQGMVLGAIVQGIVVEGRGYAGGWWDWITPFTLLTGAGVATGYLALGSCWVFLKTDGLMQVRAKKIALWSILGLVGFVAMIAGIMPFHHQHFMDRWFDGSNIMLFVLLPMMVLGVALMAVRALNREDELTPFLGVEAIFVICFVALGLSFYPYIVPPSLTIAEAASPDKSLVFMLVGAVFLVPIILAYTAYSYWVFRGKVPEHDGGYGH